jgi:hypothetical protein
VSGPRDRPTSPDADAVWPKANLPDRAGAEDGDRWPGESPQAEGPQGAAGDWSGWPSAAPVPEELLPDDAELPVSDPWAESWDSDAAEPALGKPQQTPATELPSEPLVERAAVQQPDRATGTQVFSTSWAAPVPSEAEPGSHLDPAGGPVRVSLGQASEADGQVHSEPVRPSTAEQAVPWLIGVILLLAGMVIVLLALIFAGDESLGAALPSGSDVTRIASVEPAATAVETSTPRPTPTPTLTPTSVPSATSSQAAVATEDATPTPIPVPAYGPLEMVYQGRSAAGAPIYLLHRDFTKDEKTQTVLARDAALDVRRFAWSPDGTVGAGLLSDVVVSIELGKQKRQLALGVETITFGDDASTVYAVRITRDGGKDVARVLAINFKSEKETVLARVSYPRPPAGGEAPVIKAQLSDEGGPVRLYWVDGALRLWVRGAGTWDVDPADGATTALADDARPTLWSPSADQRITTAFEDGATTITLLDDADEVILATTVKGRVSHLRWAPDGRRVAFTVNTSASGGRVLQDLFLWDLNDKPPTRLTATGAAFGAEWRGAPPLWMD